MVRAFIQEQNQRQERASSTLAQSNKLACGPDFRSCPIRYLQRTLGNQAILRLMQAKSDEPEPNSGGKEANRFGDGFGKVPVFRKPAALLDGCLCAPPVEILGLMAKGQFQRFSSGKPKKDVEKKYPPREPARREQCDNNCGAPGGGPFGNTECELDLKSGLPTGKVTTEVFDKNPCTRPCVELHEGVHAKKIGPICTAARKCLDLAGDDIKKQDKCLDRYEAEMNALTFSTECAAYTAEEECLRKRASKTECRSTDGKKRWNEQMKMVKCYKGCFCKA